MEPSQAVYSYTDAGLLAYRHLTSTSHPSYRGRHTLGFQMLMVQIIVFFGLGRVSMVLKYIKCK